MAKVWYVRRGVACCCVAPRHKVDNGLQPPQLDLNSNDWKPSRRWDTGQVPRRHWLRQNPAIAADYAPRAGQPEAQPLSLCGTMQRRDPLANVAIYLCADCPPGTSSNPIQLALPRSPGRPKRGLKTRTEARDRAIVLHSIQGVPCKRRCSQRKSTYPEKWMTWFKRWNISKYTIVCFRNVLGAGGGWDGLGVEKGVGIHNNWLGNVAIVHLMGFYCLIDWRFIDEHV